MFHTTFSTRWCLVLVLLVIEHVLSAPQGYNYYSNQQRIYAQRAQAQRLQAQRAQAQNRYQQSYRPTASSYNSRGGSVSRADAENAKFLGYRNQEKTLNHIRRKKQFAFGGNPCYFRSADQDRAEGRFLWDLNVHNYYPNGPGGSNCGYDGFGGYGGYGGYGSRPLGGGFFQNFLSLLVPGGVLNQSNRPIRPFNTPIQSDSPGSNGIPAGALSEDPSIDPSLDSTGTGTGTGGSTGNIGPTNNYGGGVGGGGGGTSLTPGQVVGGAAQIINGVIQTLSGNAAAYG